MQLAVQLANIEPILAYFPVTWRASERTSKKKEKDPTNNPGYIDIVRGSERTRAAAQGSPAGLAQPGRCLNEYFSLCHPTGANDIMHLA